MPSAEFPTNLFFSKGAMLCSLLNYAKITRRQLSIRKIGLQLWLSVTSGFREKNDAFKVCSFNGLVRI